MIFSPLIYIYLYIHIHILIDRYANTAMYSRMPRRHSCKSWDLDSHSSHAGCKWAHLTTLMESMSGSSTTSRLKREEESGSFSFIYLLLLCLFNRVNGCVQLPPSLVVPLYYMFSNLSVHSSQEQHVCSC